MLKKRSKKPAKQGYRKKSKATKETEKEYSKYSESDGFVAEPNQVYYTRPNGSGRERYNIEYKHSGYENQYAYNYWNQDTKSLENAYIDYPMYDYITKGNQQRHYTDDSKTMVTETAYSEESGTDCPVCNKHRKRRVERETDSSEYTSDYSYRQPNLRQRHLQSYDHGSHPDTSATEGIPYRKDFNVYMTHQPIGPDAFTYKQQHTHVQGYTSELMTDEEDSEQQKGREKRGTEYQVYAAHDMGLGQAELFKQLGRERMLSITDYNENIPVMAFKDKESAVHRVQSEIVYLPVLVLDSTINLPKSKIVSPESLINNTREITENHMQVYAAMDVGHNNIFELEQRNVGIENAFKNKSKTSLKSSVSAASTLSLVGTSKPGSQKGSGFYSAIHKRDIKARKERKNQRKKQKDDISVNSMALSVVSTIPIESDKQDNEANATSVLLPTGMQHKGELQEENKHNNSAQQRNSQTAVPAATNTYQPIVKSIVGDMEYRDFEGKNELKSTMDKNMYSPNEEKNTLVRVESLTFTQINANGEDKKVLASKQEKFENDLQNDETIIKPHTTTKLKSKKKPLHTIESAKDNPTEKRSLSSRLFSRKNKESSKKHLGTQILVSSGSKRILNEEKKEPFTSSSPAYDPHKIVNLNKDLYGRVEEPDVHHTLKLYGYDLTPLVNIFKIAQFFMGLSIHDKVMEVMRTFQSDYT